LIGDWDAPYPWYFETPSGTLNLNAATGHRYLLDSSGCDGGIDLRVTEDNVPQGDGEIPHRAFTSGYKIRLIMQLHVASAVDADSPPACDADLTDMLDTLGLHINEIVNQAPVGNQRLVWTPPGKASRMLDQIRLLERPVVSRTGAEATTVAFAVFSAFPYYEQEADTTVRLLDGVPATLTNSGNAAYFPVFKVYGPTNAFTLTNFSNVDELGNPFVFVYDSLLPGAIAIPAAHYAEIVMFKNTVYEDGSGANLKAGVDIPASDFWTLLPGANSVEVVGADADVIYAAAWR
jgi:hypothetical protein